MKMAWVRKFGFLQHRTTRRHPRRAQEKRSFTSRNYSVQLKYTLNKMKNDHNSFTHAKWNQWQNEHVTCPGYLHISTQYGFSSDVLMWQILSDDCCLVTMAQEIPQRPGVQQRPGTGRYSPALSRNASDL